MNRDEAIKVLENPDVSIGVSARIGQDPEYWRKLRPALDMAISAIRQQEPVTKCRDLFDEDGGEILSNSSEMTLDDAIAHLDNTLSDTGRKWSCESCRQEHVQLRAWLAELREIKQNRNEPLTLDELRKMDGEPVYIVDGDVAWWDIVSFSLQGWLYLVKGKQFRYSRYGEWLAYRQKPEECTV